MLKEEFEYPKQIDTVVEDIHKLFDGSHQLNKKNLKDLLNNIGSTIEQRFKDLQEQDNRSKEAYLRMSSLGKPDRQLWYSMRLDRSQQQEDNTSTTNPQDLIKFLYGDIIEQIMLFFCKEAGHTIELEQKTVNVQGVEGHLDCCIDGVLVDVKSTSSYGIKKFYGENLKDDDPFGYTTQLSGYKTAVEEICGRKIRQGFMVFNKENGEILFSPLLEKNTHDIKQRLEHLNDVLKEDTPPQRCYKPKSETYTDKKTGKKVDTGNKVLDTGCRYCPFKEICWNDSNKGLGLRVFDYAGGPKFFTEVKKEPKFAKEITSQFFRFNKEVFDNAKETIL